MAQDCIDELGKRPLFDETDSVLKALSQNYTIGIASHADNSFLHPVIERIKINLAVVVSSEDVQSYKPMPDIFEESLKILKVNASEVVYVGDRQYEDVEGPTSVGMKAVWVNRKNEPVNPNLHRPYAEITDFTSHSRPSSWRLAWWGWAECGSRKKIVSRMLLSEIIFPMV